jgi:hypothetical protein
MGKHLVVLHHGLWGNSQHMDAVLRNLQQQQSHADLDYLNISKSEGTLTYDGIDVCGDRCLDAILYFVLGDDANVEHLKENENELMARLREKDYDKISLIGYSLGGLILRFVIGKMYRLKVFQVLQPINYIAIAVPHLGARRPSQFYINRLLHGSMNFFLTRVGPQITVSDVFVDDTPLLVVMADPAYDFYNGLAMFKRRSLFANVINDRSVRYTTSSISFRNPYTRNQAVVLNEEFPSLVKCGSDAVVPAGWTFESTKSFVAKLAFYPILIPIWLVVASLGLGVNSFLVSRRQSSLNINNEWVKSNDELNSNNELGNSENVLAQDPDNEIDTGKLENERMDEMDADDSMFEKTNDLVRKKMIENLNSLEWLKIDVLISAFNAHAAIVQRKPYQKGVHEDVLIYLAKIAFIPN